MGEDECTAREDGGAILGASAGAEVEDLVRQDGYQISVISDQEPRVWQAGGRPKWGGQEPVCYFQLPLAVG